MARIRGGHTDPSVSCEARPSASAPQDSSQAPQSPTVLSSEGGVPSSPPQRRYSSRRPPTSLLPEPSVHHIPPKRARTSGPGETSRHSQLKPQAPADSPHPSSIAPKAIIKRPMVLAPPIEGNSDCRAKPFHFELYFDIEAMRQQPDLQDSFGLLQRLFCHILEHMGYPIKPHLEHRHHCESISLSTNGHNWQATSIDPPAIPLVPPVAPPISEHFITVSGTKFHAMHLGLLPPPRTDISGPSELIAPVEEAIPAEKTTRVDVST
uniref:Uncharacterized protein n=1 Tax=Vitis vinifera TaxID=29760 RepID=A5B640_VITVI|nr:hypothetical protein VITISV_010182 [Vitis vinifera]